MIIIIGESVAPDNADYIGTERKNKGYETIEKTPNKQKKYARPKRWGLFLGRLEQPMVRRESRMASRWSPQDARQIL